MTSDELDACTSPRWRVFRGVLTKRIYAARCRYDEARDVWVVLGQKHDVTDDVERLQETDSG